MSKIYKLYINGKPKRPGTQKYPYLGPISCCGGRKTRSNSRPNLFSSYLLNAEESAKRDNRNEFRGSKNGGREVWVGLEWPENRKIRRPTLAAAAAFAGPILAPPAVVRHETWPAGSSSGSAPPWTANVARGWPVMPSKAKTRLV